MTTSTSSAKTGGLQEGEHGWVQHVQTCKRNILRVFMIERGLVGNPESFIVHRRSPKSINQSPISKFLGLSLSTPVCFFSFWIDFTVLDCASGWKYFTKTRKCYKYSSTERTRADSIKSCKAATDNPTANLVSIRDLDTNNYVNTLSSSKFWIGAYKSSSGWTWPDGYKAIFTKWAKDQPSGDGSYMEVLDNTGSWNDLHAGYKRASVCQYDPKGKFPIWRQNNP